MENYPMIALPGRWVARLAALLAALPRNGGARSNLRQGPGQNPDTQPTTMQTIERASAFYQEKLGFSALFLAGEFRKLC